MHMLRADDPHFIQFGEIYFSTIYKGVIKGWHRHLEMTLNYACISGRVKLVIYDDRENSPTRGAIMEQFLGPEHYALVQIPPELDEVGVIRPKHVQSIRVGLLEEMQKYDRIGAYGAAAKAVVMLNYFGLDEESIPWVADVSPHKQNHFIPGTHQPIVPPAKLMEAKPDACIVFPWNITEEITRRNRDYLDAGGRFIVPIPEVHVL